MPQLALCLLLHLSAGGAGLLEHQWGAREVPITSYCQNYCNKLRVLLSMYALISELDAWFVLLVSVRMIQIRYAFREYSEA